MRKSFDKAAQKRKVLLLKGAAVIEVEFSHARAIQKQGAVVVSDRQWDPAQSRQDALQAMDRAGIKYAVLSQEGGGLAFAVAHENKDAAWKVLGDMSVLAISSRSVEYPLAENLGQKIANTLLLPFSKVRREVAATLRKLK